MGLLANATAALFLSIALGHLIGRLRIGPVQLGGVCGTLFVALAIGQLGVTVSNDLKNTAFALFIFALGFSAGPQFFVNIRSGWRYGIFSLIEVVTVLALVALATVMFGFDAGTAAGPFCRLGHRIRRAWRRRGGDFASWNRRGGSRSARSQPRDGL